MGTGSLYGMKIRLQVTIYSILRNAAAARHVPDFAPQLISAKNTLFYLFFFLSSLRIGAHIINNPIT